MIRSSLSRIRSSRSNGARSRGPKTIAGKQRSSRNALRHGLLAKQVVLANEATANFDWMIDEHIRRFGPADGVELGMIEEMAAAFWRLRRAWAIETSLMDQGVEAAQSRGEVARIAAAFSSLADSPQLALLHRYEARLHRMYQRSIKQNYQTNLDPLSYPPARRICLPVSRPLLTMPHRPRKSRLSLCPRLKANGIPAGRRTRYNEWLENCTRALGNWPH